MVNIEWGSFFIGVLSLAGSVFVCYWVLKFFNWGLRRAGKVCTLCDHLRVDIEEGHNQFYVSTRSLWHRVWWMPRRAHREAVKAYRDRWGR